MHKAVFLDRDGTIIEEVNYLSRPEQVALIPNAPAALGRLRSWGFKLVLVTNQAGIARGYFSECDLQMIHDRLTKRLDAHGVSLDGIYYCPHHPTAGDPPYRRDCLCRKPNPGMILRAAQDLSIDLSRSFMVGDKISDVEAGIRAGCKTVLVRTGWGRRDEITLQTTNDTNGSQPDHICDHLEAAATWIVEQTDPPEESNS